MARKMNRYPAASARNPIPSKTTTRPGGAPTIHPCLDDAVIFRRDDVDGQRICGRVGQRHEERGGEDHRRQHAEALRRVGRRTGSRQETGSDLRW